MSQLAPLATGAWYEERRISLEVPPNWRVRMHLPAVPDPMADDAIAAAVADPVGIAPLRNLAAGRRRPLILVDDLTRPTPVDRILPHVLSELSAAGIAPADVGILSATGSHGASSREAILRKVGAAGASCRLLAHDDLGPNVRLGRTSFGSRVEVDPEVARSDLLIGIGGIYPQNTAAFGGGAKLVLGVLSRNSIADLHFGHPSDDGRYDIANDFRRDVGEMAMLAGLQFSISAMVDHNRQLVWLRAGDHRAYYAAAVDEAKRMFAAPAPSQADIVIANAYPMDVSATFMRHKGLVPLLHARRGASRVLIAACSEGVGHHGLFPLVPRSGPGAAVTRLRRQLRYDLRGVPGIVMRRALDAFRSRVVEGEPEQVPDARRILCYVTSRAAGLVDGDVPAMRLLDDWGAVVSTVSAEQAGKERLAVDVYACSPLQILSS